MESFFLDIIKTRRSVRSYLDRPVPRDVLETIIDCARFSPTALGRQPWYFTVVTDRVLLGEIVQEIKKKIGLMLKCRPVLRLLYPDLGDKKFLSIARNKVDSPEDNIFYNAPVVIFISTYRKSTHGLKDSFLAAQNIMLASHSLGLGTCVIGFAEAINRSKSVYNKLRLPPGHRVHVTITLGYPKTTLKQLPERRRDNLNFL